MFIKGLLAGLGCVAGIVLGSVGFLKGVDLLEKHAKKRKEAAITKELNEAFRRAKDVVEKSSQKEKVEWDA